MLEVLQNLVNFKYFWQELIKSSQSLNKKKSESKSEYNLVEIH